jgi:glycosyltransferase involved in cell wall biosynthesis
MKIGFILNSWLCASRIDPDNLFNNDRGLSGSEVSLFMYAIELSKYNHDIVIFAPFTSDYIDGNVRYLDISHLQTDYKDDFQVVFSWMDPSLLQLFPKAKKIFNQQFNDLNYCVGWENYVDIITSPSQTHKDYLGQFSNFNRDKWKILPNGCAPEDYHPFNIRNNKLIYASSPDRGLHWALEIFPLIKKECPEVEFDIYYNWKSFYEQVKNNDDEFGKRARYVKECLNRLEGKGVSHKGCISKKKLIKVMNQSKLLIYPCDPMSFTEGFSVTTLESAVAGCVPVLAGADALPEIYGDYVPMVSSPFKDHKSEYIELVIKLLKDKDYYNSWQEKGKSLGQKYSWKTLTKDVLLDIVSA